MKDFKGGYIMIDCQGLDLTKGETPQTISGLYGDLQTALASDKIIVAENMVWGSGKIASPIPVLVIQLQSNLITATSATLQINITNEDVVTILNLVD